MLKNKSWALALVLVAGAAVTGCKGGGRTYSQAWYDVYGMRCGTGSPSAGCNFYWDGSKVEDWEDPFYRNYYNLEFGAWTYYDSFNYPQIYIGWGWLSGTGILYDEYGYALNEEGTEHSKDISAESAAKDQVVVEEVGKEFAEKHLLSESVGVNIAKTLHDWAILPKQKRTRTEADLADFTKRLYGVSVGEVTSALEKAKSGQTKDAEEVNIKIANQWDTSPDVSRGVLKEWYSKYLKDYQVKE